MKDRDLERWARRAVKGLPQSASFVNIWDNKMRSEPLSDPRPLIQLGYAIFLDKPIAILLPHGATLPERLARVADRIITFDPDEPGGLQRASEQLAEWVKLLA